MKAEIFDVTEPRRFPGWRFSLRIKADNGTTLLIVRGFRATTSPWELLPVLAQTPKGNSIAVASVPPDGQPALIDALKVLVHEGGEREVWGA